MKLLDAAKLDALAAALSSQGYRVIMPIQDGDEVRYKAWTDGAVIRTDEIPANSPKELLLPKSEVIARYRLEGNGFTDLPVEPLAPKTVLLAIRPCEAAALAGLDAVFNWDYKDEFYNARRRATTVVPMVCTHSDDQCFCTSVGGAPDASAEADALLRPADGGKKFILEPLSDKGRTLVEAAAGVLSEGNAKPDAPATVPQRFNRERVSGWLADPENFESPIWAEVSRACLGCGSCAYACPVCHCFDMQDEATREESVRMRNWDACGFGLFTLHAGGHNPRANQAARWRQRVMHKLSYFPDRFDIVACTGCGRCARLCGAGMSLSEVCRTIEQACEATKK